MDATKRSNAGHIDPDLRIGISGWVLQPAPSDKAPKIRIVLDGVPVRTCSANRPTPTREGKRQRCRIDTMAPLEFYDGRSRALAVIEEETGETIHAGETAFADLRLAAEGDAGRHVGAVTRVEATIVRGWAMSLADPDLSVPVALFIDDRLVDRQVAGLVENRLPYPVRGQRMHGFRFRIPSRYCDGRQHRFHVEHQSLRLPIPSETGAFRFAPQDVPSLDASFRFAGTGVVTGSIRDGLDAPFRLEVRQADTVLAEMLAAPGEETALAIDLPAALAGRRLSGPLRLILQPERRELAVAGLEPVAAGVEVRSADHAGGTLRLTLRNRLGVACRYDLVVVVDGNEHPLTAGFRAGPSAFDVRLSVPTAPRRVRVRLAGEDRNVTGGEWENVADPGVAAERAARPGGNEPAPARLVSPDAVAVAAVLAGAFGEGPCYLPTVSTGRVAGRWTVLPDGAVAGWALDLDHPRTPVAIEIRGGDRLLATATANGPALPELTRAPGPLPIGFRLPVVAPGGHLASLDALVRTADGAVVALGAPHPLEAANPPTGAIERIAWRDYTITVTGCVTPGSRPPGVPVEVHLLVDGIVADRGWAAPPSPSAAVDDGAEPELLFTLSAAADPDCLTGRVAVLLPDGGVRLSAETAAVVREDDDSTIAPLAIAPPEAIRIAGRVESYNREMIKGWLRSEPADAAADLVLYLDGVPFAHTRPSAVPDDGTPGGERFFRFELPANFGLVDGGRFEIGAPRGDARFERSPIAMPPLLRRITPASAVADRRYVHPAGSPSALPKISVIVTNSNGAGFLEKLFASALVHEAGRDVEWIVVDHGSTDDSESVCTRAAERLDVVWIGDVENFGFSHSNNLGAAAARGGVLVFANNDVAFLQGVLSDLAAALDDPAVGIVGLKLVDAVGGEAWIANAPVQHLGIHLSADLGRRLFRPYEARLVPEVAHTALAPTRVPAVTGAFFAVRAEDFRTVGGFDTGYFYGYEDVDLCLKVRSRLGKEVISLNDRVAAHFRGATRRSSMRRDERLRMNHLRFNRTWGVLLRRETRRALFRDPTYWHGHRPVVGFAVADDAPEAAYSQAAVARSLGAALQTLVPAHVALLGPAEWANIAGIDVLVVMTPAFDIVATQLSRPHFQAVAWVRDEVYRWCDLPGLHAYHQVWAASEAAAAVLSEQLQRPVPVLRPASDLAVVDGEADAEARDHLVVADRIGSAREIERALGPLSAAATIAIRGRGWTEESPLFDLHRGPAAPDELPLLYRSARLVIDDATPEQKRFALVGPQLLDALAAGAPVVTSAAAGMTEMFGDAVRTWQAPSDLAAALAAPETEGERARRERIRDAVRARHTYPVRAREVLDLLAEDDPDSLRISIKIAAKASGSEQTWGDYHFAQSLARALRALGHAVRIDMREQWYQGLAATDDVAIVLRGLFPYEPQPHQINLMWLISHPEAVAAAELAGYDHVFVASELFAARLAVETETPVDVLLQCTDPTRFRMKETRSFEDGEIVFVGNTRNVFRDVVRWAVEEKLPLRVYGKGWENYIPKRYIGGAFVPNELLGEIYGTARLVLCDHWPDMRSRGFVSNRVFDVLAAGGTILTDRVAGIEALFPGACRSFADRAEFLELMRDPPTVSAEERERISELVRREHGFAARAAVLAQRASTLLSERLAGASATLQGMAAEL